MLGDKGFHTISKVAAVNLMFWVVKVLATTLGETGGDALSMTMNLGYALSSLIFLAVFCVALTFQVRANGYHPLRYWTVVVASTTVGTTISDYLDRTLGLGYVKSSILLFFCVLLILFIWYRAIGRIEFERITTKAEEAFYWLTISVSNTLGTALGDLVATTTSLGFERGALMFAGMLAIVAVAHFGLRKIPDAFLFWAAYVLTRPLGATLGDVVTKPHAEGGLEMDRIMSSTVILGTMIVTIAFMTKKEKVKR